MNKIHLPVKFTIRSAFLAFAYLTLSTHAASIQNRGPLEQIQPISSDLQSTEKLITVINSADRVQIQYFLPRPDPSCVIDIGNSKGTRQCLKGLLSISFSGPVANPLVHLATGTSFVTGNAWAMTNSYRLVTPGATVTLPHKSSYLDVDTVMGQPQISAKTLRTIANVIQPTCVMAINLDEFCDDVQISGSHSVLIFEVYMIAVPVLTVSGSNETLPAPP